MALAGWISRWLPRPDEAAASPALSPGLPPPPSRGLEERLAEMASAEGLWSHTPAPSADPVEVRAWLAGQLTRRVQQPHPEAGLRTLYHHLLETLAQKDLALPPPPQAALRLFELLQDDEVSIQAVCEELRQEPALVQQVWSRASSALFATPPRDLHYAVARIGLRELARIAAAEVISSRSFRTGALPAEAEQVRLRCIVAAEVSTHLARHARPPLPAATPGAPYLSGLLHAVGTLLLLRTLPTDSLPIAAQLPELARWLEAPLGMIVLHAWAMPEEVTLSVGFAPDPERAPLAVRPLCVTTRAASLAVRGAQQARRQVDCGALAALRELPGLPLDPVGLFEDAEARLLQLLRL